MFSEQDKKIGGTVNLAKSESFKSDLRSTRTESRERLIYDAFPIKIFD